MAVAVSKLGYTNIKVYNGGIKDWQKSGFPLESRQPLPEKEVNFIETESFFALLKEYDSQQCLDNEGHPLLTVLDFRNANHFEEVPPPPTFNTECQVHVYQLDDILRQEIREKLPQKGKLITVTETGNRDEFAIRFLSQYGFTSIKGLRFGMRGWLKLRYPTK